jgi:hypothetical protein
MVCARPLTEDLVANVLEMVLGRRWFDDGEGRRKGERGNEAPTVES